MKTSSTPRITAPQSATEITHQATFISVVADASGSMQGLHQTVIDGLNGFIAEQAKNDNGHDNGHDNDRKAHAKVTIVQFPSTKKEDGIQTILAKTNVKTARPITGDDYVITGMTPLYDALGAVITKCDERIAKRAAKGKNPESQVVVVFTDGGENASRKYTRETIFDLIAERKAQGWVFVFLGANQDAFEEGGQVGFEVGNTRNFEASEVGMTDALMYTARSVRLFSALPTDARLVASEAIFDLDETPQKTSAETTSTETTSNDV